MVREAHLVFHEIGRRRGLSHSAVSYNTLIDGYCRGGNMAMGLSLTTLGLVVLATAGSVLQLAAGMLLSGLGLEESSFWTPENVSAQYRKAGVWCWVSQV